MSITEEPEATIDDHRATMEAIIVCMQILANYDLPRVIEQGQRSLDFGCFADPTLWRQKSSALEHDMEVLRAALPLWRAGAKLKAGASRAVSP